MIIRICSRREGRTSGLETLGEFRKEGKDALGDLKKLDASPVPNCRLAPAVAGRPETPDHLAAELDCSARSAKLHIAHRPRCERGAVFDEEAGCADVQSRQGTVPRETHLQGLLRQNPLRAAPLAVRPGNG